MIAFLTAVFLLAPLVNADPSPATAPSNHPAVIMISLDGLAGFYLDDPKTDMPTLRQLAREARAESMKVVAPSVTWPNHKTLVTGDTPARHGVVGNNYLDRTWREESGDPAVIIHTHA